MLRTNNVTIPTDWLSHGYCPRDLVVNLRLKQQDGKFVLRLTSAHRYIAFISLCLATVCFALWWMVHWDIDDTQMKWILFCAGCVFTVTAIGSALTNFRYSKYGQSLTINSENDVLTLKSQNNEEEISVASLIGLQILSKAGNSQLNIVFELDNHIERRWIHTDLTWHIELLVDSFQLLCGIDVASRFVQEKRGKKSHTTNPAVRDEDS